MHEHFDLTQTYSNINVKFPQFLSSISKNCNECKMELMDSGFNNIQSEWFNLDANVNSSRDVKKFTNPFKYTCEALSCYVCFNIY
jgi:hypothetical protein